ncbi:MAG: glycosyltransferase, partial [Deltaproteobacteria bacterium]|nr:glycosyltransferase [Deltaproteobacteria bacterium]
MPEDELTIVQVAPIASMASKGSGDYIYRIGQPSAAMGRLPGVRVINVSHVSPYLKQLCLAADVLVLHLLGEVDLLPVVAERKRLGLPTVYEISDNFMAFPKSASIREWFQDPMNLATAFQLIQMADAIQGVSDVLLRQFNFLHHDFVVFENHVTHTREKKPSQNGVVKIGWGGSVGHTDDVAYVAPVIKALCRTKPQVRFYFMGSKTQFEETFGGSHSEQFSYVPPGSMERYYEFVQGLDLGLAPMLETPYNVCRSDVKFVEYASCGVVPVLSSIAPYQKHVRDGENALLFKDRRSLAQVLERLTTDPGLIGAVSQGAVEYVGKERIESDHAIDRVTFYQSFMTRRSRNPLPFDLLQRISTDLSVSGVSETDAEHKVLEGFYAEANGRADLARRIWEEAARGFPGYAFPWICLGRSLLVEGDLKGLDYLQKGLACEPRSLRARLLFGQAFSQSDARRPEKEFRKALRVFSDFAPAWKELGLLEKRRGKIQVSAHLMNKALEVNPFYADA